MRSEPAREHPEHSKPRHSEAKWSKMHRLDCTSGLFGAPRKQTDYSGRPMPARRSAGAFRRPAGHRLPVCAGQVPGARPLSCPDLHLYCGTRRKIADNGPPSAPVLRGRLPRWPKSATPPTATYTPSSASRPQNPKTVLALWGRAVLVWNGRWWVPGNACVVGERERTVLFCSSRLIWRW